MALNSSAQNWRRGLLGLLLVAVPVLLVCWLIVYPIVVAVYSTFHADTPEGPVWNVKTYAFFFSDGFSLGNLWVTIWTTAVTTALVLIIALPIALYLRFSNGKLAAYIQSIALFPLFVPSILLAFALIRTVGPNGMLDTILNALHLPKTRSPYLTPWGPIIGLTWDNLPLTLLILLSGLTNVSTASVDAARDVGAGPLAILWNIILPRTTNSMLVAASFVVLGLFSAFTLPYLLGPAAPEMMGPFMQRTFIDINDPAQATTQAMVTFAFCAVFAIFYVRSVASGQRRR
ncbi:MAG: ABC transporter permease subunit [Devosia sp.]|nr:ABC transporter permease subunit [Devosia sp.]